MPSIQDWATKGIQWRQDGSGWSYSAGGSPWVNVGFNGPDSPGMLAMYQGSPNYQSRAEAVTSSPVRTSDQSGAVYNALSGKWTPPVTNEVSMAPQTKMVNVAPTQFSKPDLFSTIQTAIKSSAPEHYGIFGEATAPPMPGEVVPAGEAQPIDYSHANSVKALVQWLDKATPADLQRLGFIDKKDAQFKITGADVSGNDGFLRSVLTTLASPQNKFNSFLDDTQLGQMVAPVLAGGVGVSTGVGPGSPTGVNVHPGMTNPGVANNPSTLTNANQTADSNAGSYRLDLPQSPWIGPTNPAVYDVPAPSNSLGLTPIDLNAPGNMGVNALTHNTGTMVGETPIGLPSASGLSTDLSGNSGAVFTPENNAATAAAVAAGAGATGVGGTGASADHPPMSSAANPDPTGSAPPVTTSQTPVGMFGFSGPEWAAIAAGGAGAIGSILAGKMQADAATDAAAKQQEATNAILAEQKRQFDQQQTNIEPWLQEGSDAVRKIGNTINDYNAPQYEPFKFDMSGPNTDPSYTFRLDEGRKALENSAAARGGLLSGNTGKALVNYGQNAASQEYQNAFQRYNQEYQNRFNNYQNTYGTKLNALQSLAGVGQTAVGQMNQASQNYGNNTANTMMNNAAAQGQGVTGAASANASGVMGAANAVTNSLSSWLNYNQQNNVLNALAARK